MSLLIKRSVIGEIASSSFLQEGLLAMTYRGGTIRRRVRGARREKDLIIKFESLPLRAPYVLRLGPESFRGRAQGERALIPLAPSLNESGTSLGKGERSLEV